MKLFTRLLFVSMIALPFSANAEFVLSNYTNQNLAVSINDKCIIQTIYSHTGQHINKYALTDACLPDTENCSAKFFTTKTCEAASLIASFVLDVKEGIKLAEVNNANYAAEIYQQYTAKVSNLT